MIFVREEFVGGINCMISLFQFILIRRMCCFLISNCQAYSNWAGVQKRRKNEREHPQLDSERHTSLHLSLSLPIINAPKFDLLQTDRRGLKNAKVFFSSSSSSFRLRMISGMRKSAPSSIVCC